MVETVGTAVTVLEGMILEVAHLDTVESCITATFNESVNFDWIRMTGCPLHHQRIEDEIVMSQEFKFLGPKEEGPDFIAPVG